jgi:predicted DsbA family dithiol-disulfide isomerase
MLKKHYHVEIRWRAFPLHPETPEEGRTIEELFAGRDMDIPAMLAKLRRVAGELGLPWGDREKTYNSRLAQEVGKWAEQQGKGDAFHNAVFRAYFVDGKNIAKMDVLVELAREVGLSEGETREVLQARSFKEAVDGDWRLSFEWGITAVPTFVLGHEGCVGAQPYEALEQLLRNHGVQPR